jgi:hypothetical protein
MPKVTQNFDSHMKSKKSYKIRYLLQLCVLALVSYTPEILNSNIEQEDHNMALACTPQEFSGILLGFVLF